jgi:carboxypeptidase family protein
MRRLILLGTLGLTLSGTGTVLIGQDRVVDPSQPRQSVTGNGYLQGTITDQHGNPIKDVRVSLEDRFGNWNSEFTLTDKKGKYSFARLPRNVVFTLTVELKGVVKKEAFLSIGPGLSTKTVDYKLNTPERREPQ